MSHHKQLIALSFLAAIMLAGNARANDEDFQQWTQVTAQGPVADNLILYTELQPRFTDDAGRLGQLILRPAVGTQLTPDLQAMLGYAFVHSDSAETNANNEHRVWEQLSYPLYKGDKAFSVTTRTRLEQRNVSTGNDFGWRLRQQVRAQAALGEDTDLRGVVWVEPFYNFNATDWGQRHGFDQFRTFVGFNMPIGHGLALEPGYINQLVFRQGPDRVNHVLNLTLNYRWD